MSNNTEKKCSICGSDFLYYSYFKDKYTGEVICENCLLERGEISTSITTHYCYEGEYLGSSDEIKEVFEKLCDYLNLEEIEDE